ncbi:MAG TPA: putative 2OG-Fe(II) oxygenase [Roseateles sp.]
MDIKVLFPTLVAVSQADGPTMAAIQAEVLAQEGRIKSLLKPAWGDQVWSSFDAERHLFVAAGLHRLREFVESQILEFVARTRESATGMVFDEAYSQSWINVTTRFGYQERHNHEREAVGLPISGAFYFRTNGQDGDLSIMPVDMQARLFDPEVIAPAVGRLVLFRSEVFHRVGANLTDSDRISFSFNYLLRKPQ